MTEGYWRTTQAASELGISPHHMRKICEANLVEAERTQGGQWRIPMQEVNRLKKDGVPPVPLTAEPEPKAKQASQNGRTELLAPPTAAAAAAVEEVVISDAELKVRRNKLEKLEITKKATEVGDFFRNRRRQEADDEAARQRREREEQEERQRQIQQQQAAERRREWRDEWIRYGQNARPHDAPETLELDIVDQVERALEKLDPLRDYGVVRGLVDAAVRRALEPWTKSKEKREAIDRAIDMVLFRAEIDCSMMSDPERRARAQDIAADAIGRLRDGASRSEMETAATAAVQPLICEYKHAQKCEQMVSNVWMNLRDETAEEREDAKDAVRAALETLQVGASERQFEQARETALQPIRERITARQEQTRQRQEQERQQRAAVERKEVQARAKREAESRADRRLSHVSDYVQELEQRGEIEFDGLPDRWDFAEKLTQRIRADVVNEILEDPDLTDQQVEDFIEELVDDHKAEFLD